MTSNSDGRNCGQCNRRISLAESIMRCRCQQVFCERHRPPEQHGCTFDWQGFQRQKVDRDNPRITRAASTVSSLKCWCTEYEKNHPVSTAAQRKTQGLHALGTLVFASLLMRGIALTILRGRPFFCLQQLVLGYMLGLGLSRLLPQLLGYPASPCRFCMFSWDVPTGGQWCAIAEWEQLKEHLIYCITAGKQNCLTQTLYDGPRTLSFITRAVAQRLHELANGGVCVPNCYPLR